MPTTNGLNQFLVPAQDGFLYQLFYNKVYGGNTGCTIVINGTTVQMGATSSIDILVETISGGTGCFLSGDRPYVYGGDSNQYKYVPQTFVSVWDTTRTSSGSSTATQVKLPLISTGTYNFIVDWGDGSSDKITTWNQAQTTHTYATTGTYQVVITGTIQGFGFENTGDRLKILSIFRWGTTFRLGNNGAYFHGCENLQLHQVEDVLNLNGTTTFINMFNNCYNLTTIGRVNEWDVSNVTTLQFMFVNAYNFNDNIGAWNIGNVTNLNQTFSIPLANTYGKFNNGGSPTIGNWNTSKVTTTRTMFQNQASFNQDIGTKLVTVNGVSYIAWDMSNVTDIGFMFNISNQIGGISLGGVFNNGGSSTIGNWNTSKVNNMGSAFQFQPDFNQDISTKAVTISGVTYTAWDTALVTSMANMLTCNNYRIAKFNQPVGNWNTSSVTSIQSLFYNQPAFNQDLSTKVVTVNGTSYVAWDTKNVTNMGFVFYCWSDSNGYANNKGIFNGNISNWNTSKVTSTTIMFANQPLFNQDISTKVVSVSGVSYVAWDVSNVTNMSYMFWIPDSTTGGGQFNKDISNWNTSKVTVMTSMFQNQLSFNQEVGTKAVTVSGVTYSAWSVSAVTNMDAMFFVSANTLSGSFNNSGSTSINNWDVRKVTSMVDMFNSQTGFNQPISNWNISGVTAFSSTGVTQGTVGFMYGKTSNDYSATNYDNLLIGWASRPVQANKLLNFGSIKYTAAATAARTVLTSAPNNWTIVDGGLVLPFTSIWRTTAINETVTLPYLATGSTYTGTIDWGDGFTSGNTYANRTHTYATPGDYTISINGMISGFCFNNTGDKLKLREITRWGTEFRPNNNSGTFNGCTNLVLTGVSDTLNLAGMTSLDLFFNACTSLTTVKNINNWNTSNITGMTYTFQNAINFDDNIGTWDVSNVTTFAYFLHCNNAARGKFNNGGSSSIQNWNTSKVTTMEGMFAYQRFFNQDVGTKVVTVNGNTYTAWDVKNVTSFMFFLIISNYVGVFNNGGSDSIKNWNTSKAITFRAMFQNQTSFNQDIGTKVVTVNGVTYVAWDTSNVTTIAFLFNNLVSDGVFNNAGSDSIKNWDTSKMTDIHQAFTGLPYFNQDISTKSVTVSGVTYSAWTTSGVTDMSYLFYSYPSPRLAGIFNQNISNWNTANVTNIVGMFHNQTLFNQPLNSWNTVKVTNMGDVFYNATAFNQPINNWIVSGVTSFNDGDGFMSGKTFNDYSTANYDALLIGWASRPVLSGKSINFGTIKYTSAAASARAVLTSAPNNWTIIDGGLA